MYMLFFIKNEYNYFIGYSFTKPCCKIFYRQIYFSSHLKLAKKKKYNEII